MAILMMEPTAHLATPNAAYVVAQPLAVHFAQVLPIFSTQLVWILALTPITTTIMEVLVQINVCYVIRHALPVLLLAMQTATLVRRLLR
jgi:hypothetical protein